MDRLIRLGSGHLGLGDGSPAAAAAAEGPSAVRGANDVVVLSFSGWAALHSLVSGLQAAASCLVAVGGRQLNMT